MAKRGRPRKYPLPESQEEEPGSGEYQPPQTRAQRQAPQKDPLGRDAPIEEMLQTALWCSIKVLDRCTPDAQPTRELVDLILGISEKSSGVRQTEIAELRREISRMQNVLQLRRPREWQEAAPAGAGTS